MARRAVLPGDAEGGAGGADRAACRPWVAAKDVILELLRRLTVKGGVGRVIEYGGEGVATLSVPERATITNMGAELGATTSHLPQRRADAATSCEAQRRARRVDARWRPTRTPSTTRSVEIDLATLEPLVAQPHQPGQAWCRCARSRGRRWTRCCDRELHQLLATPT